MELAAADKGGGASHSASVLHHQFMYPTDLRVLGYAAGVAASVLPLHHQTSSSSSSSPSSGQIMSPLSPANLSVGGGNGNSIITRNNNVPAGSSSGSPNSIAGFSLPRNLMYSEEVLIIMIIFPRFICTSTTLPTKRITRMRKIF